ncbi:hypothetical protein ACRYJU_00485 [Alloalcanivorax xenomutans]|uniref:hypothetical protein n=1 Tax=Alloalcanivorax xenomutans TaxID=1094342 RepID=UPI003D9B2DCC
MFDVVSAKDGSGILFQSSIDEGEAILLAVEVGDIVELFIDGDDLLAEVTDVDGRNVYGVVSQVPFTSRNCGLEEGEDISFQLKNISRCMHQ